MSRRVAMFTAGKCNFISSPLINSAEYLASQGYAVEIYAVESDEFDAPTFASPDISYIPYPVPESRIVGSVFLSTPYRLNRLMGRNTYQFFVGFDPTGLVFAALLGKWRRTPYVYHSLEIVSESSLVGWRRKFDKKIERWFNGGAVLTITQDQHRADVLARENHLDRERIAVVYNSPLGDILPDKSQWFRERFDIPPTKFIVLGAGSLMKHHMIDRIVETVESWPEPFVLVLHGWFWGEGFEEKIREIADEHRDRVFISTTLLPHADKYQVFQSADIGLVFYDSIDDNLHFVGAAAGKLFDFMRCGVPVIALNLPGMKELIEDSGAGVVVDNVTDIPNALVDISHDYAHYNKRSLLAFDQYDFARSYEGALARILR